MRIKLLVYAAALLAGVGFCEAQTARQLTRKIVPHPPPPPRVPTAPAPATSAKITPAPGAPVDPAKAAADEAERDKKLLEFQKKRAEDGSATAQYDLGIRYLTGKGVEPDGVKAVQWLEKAAKNGSLAAERKLKELAGAAEKEKPASKAK